MISISIVCIWIFYQTFQTISDLLQVRTPFLWYPSLTQMLSSMGATRINLIH